MNDLLIDLPCPCSSGQKYCECHLKRGVGFYDLIKGLRLKHALNSNRPTICLLEKMGGCNSVIRSHNIQNNRILNRISVDGNVIIIGFDPEKISRNCTGIGFEKKGRNSATTYTGLCGYHDNKVFEPIENKEYKKGDVEQEYLFALRAFLFEWYKKQGTVKICEQLMNDFPDSSDILSIIKGNNIALQEMGQNQKVFVDGIEKKEYESICSFAIELSDEYLLAVSSTFGLEYDLDGNTVQDISDLSQTLKPLFLTIFPQKGHTYIIFSYFFRDKQAFSSFKAQILLQSEITIIRVINNLFTGYIENFVISPKIYRQISENEKNLFINEFEKLINTKKSPNDLIKKPVTNFFIK